jgi:hypothetical protein
LQKPLLIFFLELGHRTVVFSSHQRLAEIYTHNDSR